MNNIEKAVQVLQGKGLSPENISKLELTDEQIIFLVAEWDNTLGKL